MKTVTQLIKELQKIAETHPRAPVLVEWNSFQSDDHTHEHIGCVRARLINYDNGESSYRKDGSERQAHVVEISGNYK